MMRVKLGVCIFVSALLYVFPVYGASPDACDQYAKNAIAQLKQAQSLGLPTSPPVWDDNYQRHYNWCLGQSENALEQGSALRQVEIDRAKKTSVDSAVSNPIGSAVKKTYPLQVQNPVKTISAQQQNSDQACSRYAAESVRQNKENLSLGAGFTGASWSNDFRAHLRWCLQGDNLQTTPGHLQSREKQLQEFAITHGIDSAKRYAEESVRQNKDNENMGAGFPPPAWSSDFNSHYQWSKAGNNLTTTPGHLATRARMLQEAAIAGKSASLAAKPATTGQSPAQPGPQVGSVVVGGAQPAQSGEPMVKPLPGAAQPEKVNKAGNLQVVKIRYSVRQGVDLQAPVLKKVTLTAPNPDLCQDLCTKEKECWSYTYYEPNAQGPQAVCYLKGVPAKEIAADSCTSGAKIPPASLTIDPDSAEAHAISQKASIYKKNLQEFNQAAQSQIDQGILEANRRIQVAQLKRIQKERTNLRDSINKSFNMPLVSAADFDEAKLQTEVVQMANTTVFSPTAPVQINSAALQTAGLIPEVTGLLPVPVPAYPKEEYIQEGGYVLIFGRNFGNEPGKVMLTYHTEPVELSTRKSKEKAKTLEPWKGSWQQAWHDLLIIVKIPMLEQPGFLLYNASLTLWRDGKQPMKLSIPVRFSRKGAYVSSIRTAPEYGDHLNRDALVFGGDLAVHGYSFGNQAGKIYVELPTPLNGQNRIDLLPAKGGSWQQSWNDHFIYVSVPDLGINAPTQKAMLVIEPIYGGQGTYRRAISFGPSLVYAVVNGEAFLDLDTSAPEQRLNENGPFLRVEHDPDCTWYRLFGSEGVDYFFKSKVMPDNSRVVKSLIVPVMPDLPWTSWEIVIGAVGDMVDAIVGGPFELAKYFLSGVFTAIGSIFDDHIGWYQADVTKKPTVDNPLTRIEWYTTCYSSTTAYDLPIVYISTFLVEGPEGYCPGEIVELEHSVLQPTYQ